MKNFEYFDPTSVGEAVQLLCQHAGQAKLLAGGTDLFLRMRRRALLPEVVVDLKRIAELSDLSYSAQDGFRPRRPEWGRSYGSQADAHLTTDAIVGLHHGTG